MTLPVLYKSILMAASGKSITTEFCGEHHMGADHVEFIPSEPVHGVKRFFTTNGQVLFNDADSCFYIYDPYTLIIRIHSETWQASCLSQKRSNNFEAVRQQLVDLHPGGGRHQVLVALYSDGSDSADEEDRSACGKPLTGAAWEAGLGEASDGIFENADSQFVDRQRSLR